MAISIIVCTPESAADATLAIAAVRSGETGLLDLGLGRPVAEVRAAIARLARHAGESDRWGVRWNAWGCSVDAQEFLDSVRPGRRLPILLVAGQSSGDVDPLRGLLAQARLRADRVLFEAYGVAQARAAATAGFDGLVLKGNEAGGLVGTTSSFLLLQSLREGLDPPIWIQGAWGPETAAIAPLGGAAGVVLAEELWLAEEAPWTAAERARFAPLDGSETLCLDDGRRAVRLSKQVDRDCLSRLQESLACGEAWHDELRVRWNHAVANSPAPLPMGQGIGFASRLAERYGSVGQILGAYRRAAGRQLEIAAREDALKPDGPLATVHGTRYPIVQGPMTRVSDRAPFILSVAENGALPFLALALMRRDEARGILHETRERLGQAPWGVGVLGFVPPDLREEQLQAIREVRPKFSIVAGGRPSQAHELEREGISTYLHVPSPGLLKTFLEQGARKFIFEGRECGGHVGPRSSLALWQSAIDVLCDANLKDADSVQVLFAGGIHDALSAAMVQTLAVPLVERGMKIGVLMGSAYVFTPEAVESGAITQTYQDEAVACTRTELLESGVGHASRCAPTPFADEFAIRKRDLSSSGLPPEEVRLRLELLNVGRLRVASKGIARRGTTDRDVLDPGAHGQFVEVDTQTQRREGMYMIGSLAALRDGVQPMAKIHDDVSSGSGVFLHLFAEAQEVGNGAIDPTEAAEPIAIVGMACVFPGAGDLRAYWSNILRGVDTVRDVPQDRWDPELFYAEDRRAPEHLYSIRGSFLDELRFDPMRYLIPPAALAKVEPAQLLALEITRRALDDAGYDRRPFERDRTSVIVGCGSIHDMGIRYVQRTMLPHFLNSVPDLDESERDRIVECVRADLPSWSEDSFPGVLPNVLAGRIANRLDLRGANFVVDAACSSSLAAVHTAVEQLRSGTSDVVLAGAVDCTNNAFTFMGFAKTQALTPGEKPRPFDASADGIVLGEGVATVVLKRLADAERDGDSIYAVIRGIGCSSDGRNKSLTAPFPEAQALALRRAYEDAAMDPATVSLVEAHATGTAVGDRAEIESLTDVFCSGDTQPEPCAVGSVKSMIGHTKTSAGMAGLIKAALALKHGVLPPTINVEKPNPALEGDSPFYLNTETRPWIGAPGEHPRRAGVSAFGFGGTNFHLVLEEYGGGFHGGYSSDLSPRPAELFTWRRENHETLSRDLRALRESISGLDELAIERLARALCVDEGKRRPAQPDTVRCALLASSIEDLEAKLDETIATLSESGTLQDRKGIYLGDGPPVDPSSVCFLFPGQGAQHPGMLQDLVQGVPFGATRFEEADAMLSDLVPGRLSDRIFPPPAFDRKQRKARDAAITDTRIAQPALGVAGLFALEVLQKFGLRPASAAGHSYGESVALAAAGVFTRPGLLRLSAIRGRVLHDVGERNPGGMAAVAADQETTRAALEELGNSACLANANGPRQTIIAGSTDLLDAAIKGLMGRGIAVRRVAVSAPFHTPAMEEASDSLRAHLAQTPMWAPEFPVYSNVTAEPYPGDVEGVRDLLTRNLTSCVRFTDQIQALHRDGARLFIEVGPGRILTGLVTRILEGQPHESISLEQSGQPAWLSLGHLLARTHALGLELDLEPWFAHRGLDPRGVGDLVDAAKREAQGQPTDWWVGPTRARAAHPVPGSEQEPVKPRKPSGRIESRVLAKEGMKDETEDRPPETGGGGREPSSKLLALHQKTMDRWFELQREQVRINERFLRLHERLVAAELGLPQDDSDDPRVTRAEPPPAREQTKPRSTAATGGRQEGLPVAPAAILPELKPTGAKPAAEDRAGGPPTVETFFADLLQEVSQRTGYPEEMLDPELPLESGLGIDSIKVMEIFSALKPYHRILADPEQDDEEVLAQFVELKSLGAIREHYARRRTEILESGEAIPAAQSAETVAESTGAAPEVEPAEFVTVTHAEPQGNGKPVDRLVVRSVRSEPLSDTELGVDALRFSKQHVLLLVGDAHEYGPVLKAALGRAGYRVFQLLPGKVLRRLGERRYEADLDSADSLEALSDMIRTECGRPVGGMISLLGLDPAFREPALQTTDAPLRLAIWLLNLAKTFESQILESVDAGGGLLVNLTSLDGRFGLSDSSRPLPVAQAASTGFFKALSKEWRGVRVKNIDLDPEGEPGVLLTALLAEMARWDDLAEVGLGTQGRWSVDLVEETPTGPGAAAESVEAWSEQLALDSESVVLATGGARGITAELLRLLAAETRARLVIVGRSPLTTSEDEPAELRGLEDAAALRRELIRLHGAEQGVTPAEIEHKVEVQLRDRAMRRNLESFSDAGSQVEYHAVDVRDAQALAALVEDVYARHGRIDGVIHAAGVVEDRRLKDKTTESFERVFQTKVRSALVLARTLRPEQLKFLAFFSSLSGRFGNAGQADYSAANECLNKLADHLDREWPCRVVAMNWGPWDGGLISEALRKAYVQRGIDLISTLAGSRAFFAELSLREARAPEVVLACNAREFGHSDPGLPDA